ncbi:nucleotidyltransferase domain-containing protein [uncultured Hyphomonas sp.]|uniref:nucleotidyltransferase domain-containing protein n=1 Tax=uncultured Hyphomonas sp. TaxID=225298 RepID=UPI0030D89457|tara:strand:- start:1358 stop:2311 length:954 start_codon:yes stop_codon:yes gene_type:complete
MVLSDHAQAVFAATKTRSNDGIDKMRHAAKAIMANESAIIVGVNGSYARREATSGSDVDLFFLYTGEHKEEAVEYQRRVRERLKDDGFEMPAPGGVFSEPLSVSMTREMIGGQDDSNVQITRRMLLLLEGEWIFNESGFNQARTQLLRKYVPDNLRDDKICLFLLNDVIRYWRTICVDFEYKVQNDDKPRAIRLIKLRFSRMLLFLAGVLAIGATHGQNVDEKVETLSQYLALSAIERIQEIAGEKTYPALELYAEFLTALDDTRIREALSQKSPAGEESQEFKRLRKLAHDFRDALVELLQSHYDDDNPTVAALML